MILEMLLARFIKSIHQTDMQGSDTPGELSMVKEAVAVAQWHGSTVAQWH